MKRTGIVSIAFAAVMTLACGANNDRADVDANSTTANDTNAVGTAGDNQLTQGDRDFIEDQVATGTAEIELGKLAQQKGQNAEVKRFGQMMIDEHTKAGDELKQIASRYNFMPPAALEDQHRDIHEKLSRLQGAEFDREYMQAMIDGHQDVVDQLESRVDGDGNRAGSTYNNDAVGGGNSTPRDQSADRPGAGAAARDAESGAKDSQSGNRAETSQTVAPEHSDNPATMAVNQWAAKTVTAARRHLEQARTLNDRLEERRRNATD